MIVDAFTFLNEYDMLEFRLKLLWDKIDRFIIVEGDYTFSGKKKPYNFWENRARFAWAKDKIMYVQFHPKTVWDGTNLPTHTDPSHPCWDMEYAQRGAILEACGEFVDSDALLIGDCDEIPSRSVFARLGNLKRWEPVALRQEFFYYNLSCLRREQWNGTILTTIGTARRQGVQALRAQRNMLPIVELGGWHLSWFADTAGIQEKMHSFSHVEYDTPEFNTEAHIKECIAERKDLFVRGMQADRVGRDNFPGYFLEQSDKFSWWGGE